MSSVVRKLVLIIVDIAVINIAYFLGYFIRFDAYMSKMYLDLFMKSGWVFTLIVLVIYYVVGMYHSLWRYASINELVKLVFATTLAFVVNYITADIMKWNIPNSVMFISFILTLMGVASTRLAYRFLRRLRASLKPSNGKKRAMIIGAGDAGATIIKEFKLNANSGVQPVLIVDDAVWKQNTLIHGIRVKGTTQDIEELVKEESIDEIIIAMPSASKQRIKEIVTVSKRTGCKLRTLPNISEIDKIDLTSLRDVEIVDLLGRDEVTLDISGIRQFIDDQVVLITGGGGSIGSEICKQLMPFKPRQLLILDIYENNAYDLQQFLKRQYPNADIKIIIASVRDKERLCNIFSEYKPSIVFHAAAHKHVPFMEDHPSEAIKNNILGTLNVAQCAHENNVNRFILISTDKAVNPTNIMGATKRIAELIIQSMNQDSDTEFVAVRFGNVLGSNGSVIPLFKDQIKAGGPVTITHPDITRYFMTIPEASRLVIQAGAIAKGGEIFVLDMGEPVKIVDLATQLIELSGHIPNQDIKIEFIGLRPGEKLYEELLLEEEGLACTQQQGILIAKPSDVTHQEVLEIINDIKISLYDLRSLKHNLKKLVPSVKIEE